MLLTNRIHVSLGFNLFFVVFFFYRDYVQQCRGKGLESRGDFFFFWIDLTGQLNFTHRMLDSFFWFFFVERAVFVRFT